MRVGIYEKALPADTWKKRLTLARRAGYDYVDISIDESDARLERLDAVASERTALRQTIADTGVPILTMCLSAHRKYPLGSASPETRRRGLEILFKAIEYSADVGIRIVQVMGYDAFYEPSSGETKARFAEGLEQGARHAAEIGVMLGLENVDCPVADSVSKMLQFTREVNSPWLHLYPDMGNLAAAGYCPPDELRLAAGQLLAVHVKDAMPRVIRGIPFEQGIVPLRETFQALAEIDFCGPLGVEMWASMYAGGDPLGAAATARQLVARLIASAWDEKH